jgi:glycosyltransferase involved in cell wall biosynthesis
VIFLPWSTGLGPGEPEGLLAGIPEATPIFVPSAGPPGWSGNRRLTPFDPGRGGAGAALNAVAESTSGSDLVVVADNVTLPGGWLERLRWAAFADDTVAAATALAIGSGEPLFKELEGISAASPTGAGTPIHPRLLELWPHCAWIRRPALELVGGFDPSLTHPAAALADFAARIRSHGLACALADDLCLERHAPGLDPCPAAERQTLYGRYAWLEEAERDETALDPGPLRWAVRAAGRAGRSGISVTVDARSLGAGVGGTQTYVASLILALSRHAELDVRAMVRAHPPAALTEKFAHAGVGVITHEQALAGVPHTDVVHRPQQVFTPDDLRLLPMVGDRVVISQMDLIGYRNPTYHGGVDVWRAYRRTTRLALSATDWAVFFSDHGRREAISEQLVNADRTTIAGIGVEVPAEGLESVAPTAVPEDRDLLLILGADYAHKNRPFGMALTDELRRRHGWDGILVLAGPHQPYGSSAPAERDLLRARPDLASHVLDLGPVSEPEKRWLLRSAQAQLYPSTYEGFGLGPLESAAFGTPCIFAPCTSLREILDPEAATIVPWDVAASANAAASLLYDAAHRERHLAYLSQALERFSWERVVADLVSCYRAAIASQYRGAAFRAWDELTREELIIELHDARVDLQERVAYGQLLIDRRGGLLTRAQQRGLMRVASRPWLRGPLLGPFGALGADERERR